MIRDLLRRVVLRALPEREVPLPIGTTEVDQLVVYGRVLRSIVRSRGGQIVIPRECWSAVKTERLVLSTHPEGLVLRFGDAALIDPAYQAEG